jgi:hypothetical protein
MSLPELDWQIVYGRLAWAIVLAALITALLPRSWRLSRSALVLLLVCAAALQVLPNEISLAYWLGLAFQWPSGLLVGLSLVKLHSVWRGRLEIATINHGLATIIVLAGGILYLEAIGWISHGFYYWGFSPIGAPLLGLLIAIVCSATAIRGYARPQALALLAAVVAFAVLRLPTGNLWDAVLDPLLWGWAIISLAGACWRWRQPGTREHVSSS